MPSTLHKVLHTVLATVRSRASRVGRLEGVLTGARRAAATANVSQLMTRNPRTLGLDSTLHGAAQIMWDSDCGCVPVVDADEKFVGMITDRDVCMAAYTQGRALWQVSASSAASRNPISIREGDTVDTAHRLMRRHRVRRLAVIDTDGRPVGILSLCDLARHVQVDAQPGEFEAAEVATTLRAICEPVARASAAAE